MVFSQLFLTTVAMAEEFDAILGWSKRVELSTSVNGIVKKVFAQVGRIAAKGEILVQLDSRILKADLKYAKAMFKNMKGQSLEAKRELARQMDMYERTMLSEHDLQVAKNNFTSALAQFHQSQAFLEKAKLNLEYSAIRAPFKAIIISSVAVTGQVIVSEVTPPILVTVAEAHRMLARFYVAIDKANKFLLKKSVKVYVLGREYAGTILKIALEPDKLNLDLYAVDVVFDLKDKLLRAGQKVTVDL